MLTVIGLDQSERWDSIIRSFSNHDVYWFSGYTRAFQIHGDGDPFLVYYEDENTRGINVVMKRDIASAPHFSGVLEPGVWFDLASPYGYGGWLIEGTDSKKLFAEYEKWCRDQKIVSEFVRFHPMVKNHIACEEAYQVIPLGEVVHMDLSSPEEIWSNIISKNRNVIRKAIKNDVKIYNGRDPELFKIFRSIYNETMEKDAADSYYYFPEAFYESVLNDLPLNAQVFYAVKDGVVIAASIMLTENGMMNYHLSGSLRAYSSLAATNLILYHAALWGHANGCRTLYMGGGVGSGEDGLFKFKRAFYKGDLNRFHIGKKIFDQEAYNYLIEKRTEIQRKGFFPEYRA